MMNNHPKNKNTEKKVIFFRDQEHLQGWLNDHHMEAVGIWAVFYKKSTKRSDLSWEAVVEACLCFGWIDSLGGKVDDEKTKLYISPRKITSGWSKRNKEIVQRLEKEKRLHANGIEVINRAKKNGSWKRFDDAEAGILPIELQKMLSLDQTFKAAWNSLSMSQKRSHLQLIYDAKTISTRLNRLRLLQQRIINPS
jgi:uncharacterized protein YdeI (YjbR/CyaY-like superfamily)